MGECCAPLMDPATGKPEYFDKRCLAIRTCSPHRNDAHCLNNRNIQAKFILEIVGFLILIAIIIYGCAAY